MSGPRRRARENLTEIVSVLVTGIWLAALFTGQGWWLAFMLIGYIAIVPVTALLTGDSDAIEEWWDEEEDITTSEQSTENDALETLRDRYARGELTDEEFERKVERLLETESIEDIENQTRHSNTARDEELEK
jgi:uncharacterized membrane protein